MNTLLDSPSIFFFFFLNQCVSNLIIRIFWGTFVSRSFTFTVPQWRNDLPKPPQHLTSSEERLFLHLSISIGLHCIMFGSFKYFTKTYYWRYRVTTDIYIFLCKYLLYCYKDITDLHYKHQNFITFCPNKYQHLHQITYFCSIWVSE